MKLPLLTAAVLGALLLSGCAAGSPTSSVSEPVEISTDAASTADDGCAGIAVVADFGILDAPAVDVCVDSDQAVLASEAIATAGITTEGNADYGDAVVCRVDGRPAADETVTVDGQEPFIEPCSSMSPAYAFWAIWVKPAADAEWGFAMEGLETLKAEPGQSIGLVYTTGTGTDPQPPTVE
ncbi:hypothetical protein [Microterricola gilva]|nr:hypothetical protein [Microterricola gilva]